jgi:hypothetical protein
MDDENVNNESGEQTCMALDRFEDRITFLYFARYVVRWTSDVDGSSHIHFTMMHLSHF